MIVTSFHPSYRVPGPTIMTLTCTASPDAAAPLLVGRRSSLDDDPLALATSRGRCSNSRPVDRSSATTRFSRLPRPLDVGRPFDS